MSQNILEISNLSIQYPKNPWPAVEGFNLSVKEGEIVSIVGESGSGKTSVIRAILGLLPVGGQIFQGEIIFNNRSLLNLSYKEWRRLRGTDISMIFQDSGAMLNPIKKIGTQFVEYIRTHEDISRELAYKKALNMLSRMQLPGGENIMDSYAFQLSGGMCQRVGIAMAMTFSPKLLLADEPTSALDVTIQSQIVKQIMDLRNEFGTTVIMVTHNIGVAAYMGDRLLVMQSGKIVDEGRRDEIIKSPKNAYTEKLLEAVPKIGGNRYA